MADEAQDVARVGFGVDTSGLKQLDSALDSSTRSAERFDAAQDKAAASAEKLGTASKSAADGLRLSTEQGRAYFEALRDGATQAEALQRVTAGVQQLGGAHQTLGQVMAASEAPRTSFVKQLIETGVLVPAGTKALVDHGKAHGDVADKAGKTGAASRAGAEGIKTLGEAASAHSKGGLNDMTFALTHIYEGITGQRGLIMASRMGTLALASWIGVRAVSGIAGLVEDFATLNDAVEKTARSIGMLTGNTGWGDRLAQEARAISRATGASEGFTDQVAVNTSDRAALARAGITDTAMADTIRTALAEVARGDAAAEKSVLEVTKLIQQSENIDKATYDKIRQVPEIAKAIADRLGMTPDQVSTRLRDGSVIGIEQVGPALAAAAKSIHEAATDLDDLDNLKNQLKIKFEELGRVIAGDGSSVGEAVKAFYKSLAEEVDLFIDSVKKEGLAEAAVNAAKRMDDALAAIVAHWGSEGVKAAVAYDWHGLFLSIGDAMWNAVKGKVQNFANSWQLPGSDPTAKNDDPLFIGNIVQSVLDKIKTDADATRAQGGGLGDGVVEHAAQDLAASARDLTTGFLGWLDKFGTVDDGPKRLVDAATDAARIQQDAADKAAGLLGDGGERLVQGSIEAANRIAAMQPQEPGRPGDGGKGGTGGGGGAGGQGGAGGDGGQSGDSGTDGGGGQGGDEGGGGGLTDSDFVGGLGDAAGASGDVSPSVFGGPGGSLNDSDFSAPDSVFGGPGGDLNDSDFAPESTGIPKPLPKTPAEKAAADQYAQALKDYNAKLAANEDEYQKALDAYNRKHAGSGGTGAGDMPGGTFDGSSPGAPQSLDEAAAQEAADKLGKAVAQAIITAIDGELSDLKSKRAAVLADKNSVISNYLAAGPSPFERNPDLFFDPRKRMEAANDLTKAQDEQLAALDEQISGLEAIKAGQEALLAPANATVDELRKLVPGLDAVLSRLSTAQQQALISSLSDILKQNAPAAGKGSTPGATLTNGGVSGGGGGVQIKDDKKGGGGGAQGTPPKRKQPPKAPTAPKGPNKLPARNVPFPGSKETDTGEDGTGPDYEGNLGGSGNVDYGFDNVPPFEPTMALPPGTDSPGAYVRSVDPFGSGFGTERVGTAAGLGLGGSKSGSFGNFGGGLAGGTPWAGGAANDDEMARMWGDAKDTAKSVGDALDGLKDSDFAGGADKFGNVIDRFTAEGDRIPTDWAKGSADAAKELGTGGTDASKALGVGGDDASNALSTGGDSASTALSTGGDEASTSLSRGGTDASDALGKGGNSAGDAVSRGGSDAGQSLATSGQDAGSRFEAAVDRAAQRIEAAGEAFARAAGQAGGKGGGGGNRGGSGGSGGSGSGGGGGGLTDGDFTGGGGGGDGLTDGDFTGGSDPLGGLTDGDFTGGGSDLNFEGFASGGSARVRGGLPGRDSLRMMRLSADEEVHVITPEQRHALDEFQMPSAANVNAPAGGGGFGGGGGATTVVQINAPLVQQVVRDTGDMMRSSGELERAARRVALRAGGR